MASIKHEPRDIHIIESREGSIMGPRRRQTPHQNPLVHRESAEPLRKHRVNTHFDTEEQLPTPTSQTNSDDDDALSNTPITAQPDSMAALGIHSRQLIQVINRLESLGIQSTLPSLPKFVVVGDQSAGKSSIVEALCNVSLPRQAGTCTRCPFLITTSTSNSSWRCEVSLIEKYVYDAAAFHTTLDRWIEQPVQTTTFEIVEDKARLGEVLQRAQAAVLSLGNTRKQFSPNIICLTITGADLPELSFYDLPGSINVVENDDDQHLVEFVEKLVKLYLVDEKALIMLACASDQDIENSTTFKFVRQCKAERRCLGVLTKPDLLPHSRLNHASRMLNGDVFRLGRGWFVTKQPSQIQLDRGMTHVEARQHEQDFFAHDIWNGALSRFSTRYGIPHLQAEISRQLRQHILDNIGEIINRVETRANELRTLLQSFRIKDPHPLATVMTVLGKINQSIVTNSQSPSENIDFRPRINKLKEQFRNQLRAMAPELDPTTPDMAKKSRESVTPRNADVIMLDDDDDDEHSPTPASRPQPGKRRAEAMASASSKRVKVEPVATPTVARVALKKVVFTIPQLQEIKQRHTESSIPEQVDPKVHEVIILQSMGGWQTVLDGALAAVRSLVHSLVTAVLEKEMYQYQSCELFRQSQQHARSYVDNLLNMYSESVKDWLACELYKPATVIDIASNKLTAAEELYKKRNTKRINEAIDKHEQDTGKQISIAEKQKRLNDNITKPDSSDPYMGIVKLLVLPLAYYRVAADRFADTFALQLEYKLVRVLKADLTSALTEGLGIQDVATCEQLLVEDADRERQRQRLVQEMERLERAMQELNELPNSQA